MAFNPDAITFNAANALLLAEASEAAYMTETEACDRMSQLGLPNFQWIDLSGIFQNLHAFAASNNEIVILAFRGTADVKDWMTDLHATPVRFSWIFQGGPEVGEIHAGFGHALSDGWRKVLAALNKVAPQPALANTASVDARRSLWITGHSLGGAIAALTGAAFSLLPDGVIRPVSGIYTSASRGSDCITSAITMPVSSPRRHFAWSITKTSSRESPSGAGTTPMSEK